MGAVTDVDGDVRTVRQLRYRAEHDPVTGYSNLAKFKLDATRLLVARAGRKYALWHCDFRNFKYINDMYGYDVGNRLLKYWADLTAASFSSEETFARATADNFVMLCAYRDIAEMETRFWNAAELLGHFEELASKRFRVEVAGGCYLVGRRRCPRHRRHAGPGYHGAEKREAPGRQPLCLLFRSHAQKNLL